jgi:hypothetical protein
MDAQTFFDGCGAVGRQAGKGMPELNPCADFD